MPSLADHHSASFVKLMYIGDSGTGKTGSLDSLLADGYRLYILDLDNGLDALVQQARLHQRDLSLVNYETVRDSYKMVGTQLKATPKAFVASMKLLTKWSDDSVPAEWGDKTVFVLDSLSALGKSAFAWAESINPSARDPRQWYFQAQQALENLISMLTSEEFRTNVIIISHVNYRELPNGLTRGYANSIGSALGPTIPKYFNSMVMAESVGSGANVQRRIKTVPTGIVDLKTPIPFRLDKELPLETGMSTIFQLLKDS